MLKYLIGIIVCLFLTSCSSDKWEGIVYHDQSTLTKFDEIGVFDTLDECRVNAQKYLAESSHNNTGTYECGLNCERDSEVADLKVCEKTSD